VDVTVPWPLRRHAEDPPYTHVALGWPALVARVTEAAARLTRGRDSARQPVRAADNPVDVDRHTLR
jgi:hypothetical protein